MAGIVDVPARTGNRPAAIQRFQAIYDSRQIFDDGQVAPGEFSQHQNARLAMVDRLEIIEAYQFRELARIGPVIFAPVLQQSAPAWIGDYDFGNVGLEED